MNKIVGIQFKSNDKVYDFDSGHFVLKKGDKVMVITAEGPAIGCVCAEPQNRTEDTAKRALKKIFRLATKEEIEKYERVSIQENDVFCFCLSKIKDRSLPMRLVSVEKRFDGSRIVVYFTADGRVDFRQLVKDLVGEFRTRIEMRQIGVRHQAKMIGALGVCGRPICCSTFLKEFAPVTIKMAKEQNISLNPTKISGMCGRLMCCLTYEYETYMDLKKDFPKIGKKVTTPGGTGKVVRHNVIGSRVTVRLDGGSELEAKLAEISEKKD